MDRQENTTLTPDCERLRDLLPAYSFGIADAEEKQLVESLLPLCPEVAAELDDYRQLSDTMLFSVPLQQPSPQIFTWLMQATAPVKPIRHQRWMLPAAAALAVALIINLAALAVILRENIRLSGQIETQTALLVLLAREDVVRFVLDDVEGIGVNAVLLCHPDEKVALVQAQNFPTLPPDMAYHVWLWKDGQRSSGGWMRVKEDGSGTLVFNAPESMGTYEYIGIAPEPLGNVEQQFAPVMRGKLYE